MVWGKLPIVIHCTDFKNEAQLKEILQRNLFQGLSWQEQIRLAKEIYADAHRFLACTNGSAKGECKFCREIIKVQRKVAQEILLNTQPILKNKHDTS